jgi:signal transduction histidine kinase/FixJ family two-component response regulator/HPt (histidine-containing phosphotransfer) domain-containing protein
MARKTKPLSALTGMLFAAGLPLLLWGCAGGSPKPDPPKNGFYINLNDFPFYAKSGFDPADTATVPDAADGSWQVRMAGEQKPSKIVRNLGLDRPRRFFLSPFEEEVREYTMIIPFTVSPEQFEKINGKEPFLPGIFLAALGDNWEIFLNGHAVKSEIHPDGNGRIESHRSRRSISFPLERAFFVPGTNILAFRVVGEPNGGDTGLWYEDPYYIGGFEDIRKRHDESLTIAFCAVYLFAGIYHFLYYLNRTRDRYNLYYCFFSTLLGIYFFMRSAVVYSLIPDSDISFRIEYASIFMVLPMLAAFLEHLSLGKIRKVTLFSGGICLLFSITQGISPNLLRDDILYLWWVFEIFEVGYILFLDTLYAFVQKVRDLWKAEGKRSLSRAFLRFFTETPLGNILMGTALVAVTGAVDAIRAVFTGYGFLTVSRFGLVIFTITTTVILARRFGILFSRLDEMNSLLEASNLNLEATVRERTRELELQTEVAKSASRAKSDFLARMSHEIRTPLNAVLGLSEVELQGALPDRTRLNLEKIYHSGSQLLEIVNDILDISKIESGNFEIVPAEYELCGVINDTIQINIVRIGIKPVEFKLEIDESIPSKLYGDELRIKQVLNNLLSNAFKYTGEGNVRLVINWERREDTALLYFAVEDTGRGIKKEDMGKLFAEYTQFEPAVNRRIEGTGLGLSITRGLVERMGGSVTVESEHGRGSVFRVTLPQGILDERPIGGEAVENLRNLRFIEDRNRSRGNTFIRSWMPYGKVLVVDDLQTNLDVMKGLLMPYGLRVDTAISGREAVAYIRAEEVRYDLIFMDHMMPEMDGIEAVRIIRNGIAGPYAQQVAIVAVTANAVVGNREMFLESGFTDFISKPIDIKQLDMVLNRWIRDKQSQATLKEAEDQQGKRIEGSNAGQLDAGGKWLLEHPVEGIDFAAVLRLYGGSGAACLTILKSFVTHTPRSLERMDAGLASSSQDYTIEVHGLKGTCNAVGAAGTAALARELEFAAKEGNFDLVQRKHGILRREALELTERLKALLSEWEAGRPGAEKESRAEPERALLVRLSAAAAEFNSNAVEEILGELERYHYQEGQEFIDWLREQAEDFDYDAMHKKLTEFLGN